MAAAPYAIPDVVAAIRARLVVDTLLSSMLASYATGFGTGTAIYSEDGVPPKAGFPYLTIGAATEVPFDTMGDVNARGSELTVQVKAVSAKMRDDEAHAIMRVVRELLDEAQLTVSGYGSAVCERELTPALYVETVGGVVVRHAPMIFRVHVHQSA